MALLLSEDSSNPNAPRIPFDPLLTRGYGGDGAHYVINTFARTHDMNQPFESEQDKETAKYIRDLDNAVSKSLLPEDALLMRNTKVDSIKRANGLDSIKPGDVFTDKGFMSTSRSAGKDEEDPYVPVLVDEDKSIQGGVEAYDFFAINAKEGQSGLFNPEETEVILPRGTTLKCTDIQMMDHTTIRCERWISTGVIKNMTEIQSRFESGEGTEYLGNVEVTDEEKIRAKKALDSLKRKP